jgi:hypothetical protein
MHKTFQWGLWIIFFLNFRQHGFLTINIITPLSLATSYAFYVDLYTVSSYISFNRLDGLSIAHNE